MKMGRKYEYHGFRIEKESEKWEKLENGRWIKMNPKFKIEDINYENNIYLIGNGTSIEKILSKKFGIEIDDSYSFIDQIDEIIENSIYDRLCPYLSILSRKLKIDENKINMIGINEYFLLKFDKSFIKSINWKEIFEYEEILKKIIKIDEIEELRELI